MTREQRQARIRQYRNSAAIVALLSFCGVIGSFIGFVLVSDTLRNETGYLAAFVVSAALVIPVTITFVALRYSRRLARRFKLVCPHCGTALSASLSRAALTRSRCSHCGQETLNEAA